jgi:hypothetical protein
MQTLSLTADHKSLGAFGRVISCSCLVVNEFSTPPRMRVVYSENADGSQGMPYMPRIFPSCINGEPWNIYAPVPVDPAKDPKAYMQPFFIPTDAWQWVQVWDVNQSVDFDYVGPALTGGEGTAGARLPLMIKDYGYGIHFSMSVYTDGCEKITEKDDLLWLVDQVRAALNADGGLKLLVA